MARSVFALALLAVAAALKAPTKVIAPVRRRVRAGKKKRAPE